MCKVSFKRRSELVDRTAAYRVRDGSGPAARGGEVNPSAAANRE